MKRNKTRICICCGKEYQYCPRCDSDKDAPRWMMNFDTDACHVAFQVVTDYNYGEITREEAVAKLNAVDLSDLESYIPDVKDVVKKILTVDKVLNVSDAPKKSGTKFYKE